MEIKNSMLSKLDPYRNKLDPKGEAAGVNVRGAKAEASAAQNAGRGDRVSLSSTARLHTAAHAEATGAPDIRQEKINSIKERVASGEYQVDAKKVASKLLQDEAFMASALKD